MNPLDLYVSPPEVNIIRCDTMCGSFVLIPGQVANELGIIDSECRRRWGDLDCGLSAHQESCKVWIGSECLTDSDGNPDKDT